MNNPITYWRAWWSGNSAGEKVAAIAIFALAIAALWITIAWAAPAPEIGVRLFVPIDVVALTQAVFTGIAAVGGVFATIYSLLAAARAKRGELLAAANAVVVSKVQDTVTLVERNTNSITRQIEAAARLAGFHEGEIKGRLAGEDAARTLAEGQKQGVEVERASVAAGAVVGPRASVAAGAVVGPSVKP